MKEMKCNHYKGDGYYYRIKLSTLYLCEDCNKILLKQMKAQEELEKKVAKTYKKIVKQRKADNKSKRRRRKVFKW